MFGLNEPSSDFLPRIKFNAKTGRYSRVYRTRSYTGDWETEETDIAVGCSFVLDLDSPRHGWIDFDSTPPSFLRVPGADPLPKRPSDSHKHSASFEVMLTTEDGKNLHDFSSCARGVIGAMAKLIKTCQSMPEYSDHPAAAPMVSLIKAESVGTKHGTIFVPVFEVKGWRQRPAEFNSTPDFSAETRDEQGLSTESDDEDDDLPF